MLLDAFQIDDNNNLELIIGWRKCEVFEVPGAGLAEGGGLPVDQLAPELVHLLLHPLHLGVKPATGTFVITSVIIMSIFSSVMKYAFPLEILQVCTLAHVFAM